MTAIFAFDCSFAFVRLDKKSADDVTQRFVISDESLKKCPGYDKLRPDAREKVKHYLQDQVGE